MNQKEQENSKQELNLNLKEQVNTQLATLTTRIPAYEELNDEEKEIVDRYVETIDLYDTKTIYAFGKGEAERYCQELNILIGIIRTHDMNMDEMFAELRKSISENSEPEVENFFDLLKKSPLTALSSLKDRPKRITDNEGDGRDKILANIDEIREKLESIRNAERINAGKLEIIAQNMAEININMIYQIIALQEVEKKIQKMQKTRMVERSFLQIERNQKLIEVESRINGKMQIVKGTSVIIAHNTVISKISAQNNEGIASDYDRLLIDLLSLMSVSMQDAGRPTNEAFTEILDNFRSKLMQELDINNNHDTTNIEEDEATL